MSCRHNEGPSKENLQFDEHSKRIVTFLFYIWLFSNWEIETCSVCFYFNKRVFC